MDRLPKYVKFKGAFRDLKGRGYRFWRAYANNYRVYTKSFHKEHQWGDWANIWQHHGGYLEVDQFMGFTYLLVELIARGEHKKWVYAQDVFDRIAKKGTDEEVNRVNYMEFFLNTKDGTLIVADETFSYESRPNAFQYRSQNVPEEEFKAMLDEYHSTWRSFNVMNYIFEEIETLLRDGLIEVVPDTRKY